MSNIQERLPLGVTEEILDLMASIAQKPYGLVLVACEDMAEAEFWMQSMTERGVIEGLYPRDGRVICRIGYQAELYSGFYAKHRVNVYRRGMSEPAYMAMRGGVAGPETCVEITVGEAVL